MYFLLCDRRCDRDRHGTETLSPVSEMRRNDKPMPVTTIVCFVGREYFMFVIVLVYSSSRSTNQCRYCAFGI